MNVLLTLLLSASALAETFGTVAVVTVPDASGYWERSSGTPEAVVVSDGVEKPLTDGMTVEIGDVVRTGQARVELDLGGGEHLNVGEGSELTLRERGVLQTLGSVYYSLRDVFKVEYGYVEATVEGTGFLIEPGEHRIGVSNGAVRVASGGSETLVEPRQQLSVASEGRVSEPDAWSRRDMGEELQRTWPFDRPVLVLAALGGLGAGRGPEIPFDGNSRVRPFEIIRFAGRASPIRGIWVTGSAGFRATGTRFRTFPFSAGAEVELGPFAAGAELVLAFHDVFYPGATATGRISIPLGRTVYLEGQGRLGWVADPYIEAAAGLAFGL